MNWNDPAVWSMIIAAVAVILSQVPPVRELLKGKKIKITIPSSFQLYHHLGNINISMFLDIHNIGGLSVSIDKLLCLVGDNDGKVWILPAQGYIPRSNQPTETPPEFPVGRVVLKPDERWNENTHFYKSWTEADEEIAGELTLEIRDYISRRLPSEDGAAIRIDDALHQRVVNFFNRNFKLQKGNYYLLVVAYSENDSVIEVKGYEFTLYENHIKTLLSYIEDYRYGAGVYFPIRDAMKFLWIRLRLINDDKRVRQIYEKLTKRIY